MHYLHNIGEATNDAHAFFLARDLLNTMHRRTRRSYREHVLVLLAHPVSSESCLIEALPIKHGANDHAYLHFNRDAFAYIHTHPGLGTPSPADLRAHIAYAGFDAYGVVVGCARATKEACTYLASVAARAPSEDDVRMLLRERNAAIDKDYEQFVARLCGAKELPPLAYHSRLEEFLADHGFDATARPYKTDVVEAVVPPQGKNLIKDRALPDIIL